MNNAIKFASECVLIIIELNVKAKNNGYEGYPIMSHDYYEGIYNHLIKKGLSHFQINLIIVSIATGEFN